MADASQPTPLQGTKVVEVASFISVPFASAMLAHLGAAVVKVEPPRGDPFRAYGPRQGGLGAPWISVNRGKRGVVADLKTEVGRAQVIELVRDADVFVQNWRPGVAESLGLGSEAMTELNPRLIYLSVSGFGQTGPKSEDPAFDVLIQATSGFAHFERVDGNARVARSFLADKVTSMMAAQGVLGALLLRAQTGRGSVVDVAMVDAMSYFDFPDVGRDRTFLDCEGELLADEVRLPLIRTSDGHLVIQPFSGTQIGGAIAAVGHPEWKDDLKQTSSSSELNAMLYERLESVTVGETTDHWMQRLLANDVPAAAVVDFDEHLADPQTVHNELYGVSESPVGRVRHVNYPARFDGRRLPGIVPPPDLPKREPGTSG